MIANGIRSHERHRWFVLATVMIGSVMGPLDGSIANVAMPSIARVFHRGVDEAEWVLLAYMLVTASTLVFFGRLGDMAGQKRVYLAGFATFGTASLACSFASSLEWLIAARVVQALGSAMLMACAPAIVVNAFPASQRGRAIGFNGAAVATGLSTGPILGGLIVSYDWRWIFLINVPIAIVALVLAKMVLHPTPPRDDEGFDIAGAMLSIVGLLAFSLALSRAHVWGWNSDRVVGLLIASAAAFVAFLAVERRAAFPTLDLALFRNRLFAVSTIAAFAFFIAYSGIVFIVPLGAQLALGASPLHAGALLVPLTLLNVVLAPLAGTLSDRLPVRIVSTAGALTVTIGAALLAHLPPVPTTMQLVAAVALAGVGTAVFSQPNNSAIMGSAPANRRGIAAGTLATARTTGQLVGVALSGAIYFGSAANLGALGRTFVPATLCFGTLAVLLAIVTALSFLRDR